MQDKITKLFKAIADPTRREIFHALIIATSALSITQISNQFDISRQGVTKHIKTLEDAGLVVIDIKGRERFCNANAKPLKEVDKWLKFYEQFWTDKLTDLGNYLNSKNSSSLSASSHLKRTRSSSISSIISATSSAPSQLKVNISPVISTSSQNQRTKQEGVVMNL